MKLLFWLLCLPMAAFAAPDLSKPLGPTIADTGSAYYHFDTHAFTSADGQRHYRVVTALPNKAPPASGYPVIYLLDGNSALASLNYAMLATLQDNPPVIVTVGYQTKLRFDVRARAFDYTEPRRDGKAINEARPGGGSDAFLALLTGPIKAHVRALVKTDPARQTLWGHSFGGLFVLYALTQTEGEFSGYAAADPALWWQGGDMLTRLAAFAGKEGGKNQVLIMHGGAKAPERVLDGAQQARLKARQQMMGAVPKDAALEAARRLAGKAGITSHYREFPALSHGPLFGASLMPALRLAQGHLAD